MFSHILYGVLVRSTFAFGVAKSTRRRRLMSLLPVYASRRRQLGWGSGGLGLLFGAMGARRRGDRRRHPAWIA